ncbi:MAG: hypothetical protein AUH72_07800 [Acidobacteria bacterium 13_1_40CM_4_65_8]|nr:MAG: hypothetical protein AUH72_07800 [Acidobacteria bacterium 13_1_40CM_4_65_8]
MEPELVADLFDMVFRGPLSDDELLCDLTVGKATSQELRDLMFPARKLRGRRVRARAATSSPRDRVLPHDGLFLLSAAEHEGLLDEIVFRSVQRGAR